MSRIDGRLRFFVDVHARLNGLGLTPVGGTAAEFGALYKSEVTRWKKVSQEAGVKIE